MKQIYLKCLRKLKQFRKMLKTDKDIKRGKMYFSWITEKTDKIKNEQNPLYICNRLKQETLPKYNINNYVHQTAKQELKDAIDRNYTFDGKKYKLSNFNITDNDVMLISKKVILKRGNVVWVDFGFNIGNEFGGMHPAIILKNLDNELFVLPVSSKKPLEYIKIENEYKENKISLEECENKKKNITEIVQLDNIFGYKNILRWSNITRMKKVSVLRLNFSGSIGSIDGKYMNLISQKIGQEF